MFIIATSVHSMLTPGKPCWRGTLSTVDLLVLTNLDQLLLIMQALFIFNKTSCLNEEVKCTEISPSVSVPCSHSICFPALLQSQGTSLAFSISLGRRCISDKKMVPRHWANVPLGRLTRNQLWPFKMIFCWHCCKFTKWRCDKKWCPEVAPERQG